MVSGSQNQKNWKAELAKFTLMYQCTPHPALSGRTPSEAMMQRNVNDILPNIEAKLHPKDEPMRDADATYKLKSKIYTDNKRNAQRTNLKIGDTVMMNTEALGGTKPKFGPEEFKIKSIQGHKISIESSGSPKKSFVRHPTQLKKIPQRVEGEDPEESAESRLHIVQEGEEESEMEVKPSRERKKPSKLQDYVLYWASKEKVEGDDL